jgi:metal-responsive CopG/Arc/MetJ family transcriptional regulator
VKKAKCITIDASLVTEAEKAAAKLGTTFSALVEEALRRLLRQPEAWRGVEEKLASIEVLLRQCLQREAQSRGPSSRSQEPTPQLGGNAWVEILRRRG